MTLTGRLVTDQRKRERLAHLEALMREIPLKVELNNTGQWPEPEYELTMAQFKVLTYLQPGPQRMGDISRFLGVSLSSVTNLVSRLESKGLAVRSHDTRDRRVVTCELTAEGRDTVTRLWHIGRERLLTIAAQLSDDELDQIIRAFEILTTAAEKQQRNGEEA